MRAFPETTVTAKRIQFRVNFKIVVSRLSAESKGRLAIITDGDWIDLAVNASKKLLRVLFKMTQAFPE